MKLFRLFLLMSLLISRVDAQDFRSKCPVYPAVNTQQLPDGTFITLTSSGNEAISYLETMDGFTVLANNQGFFEYARLDAQGNLGPSGLIARDGETSLQKNLAPHLRYSAIQVSILLNAFAAQNLAAASKKAGGKPFPAKGSRKLLTLLIQYPDLPATLPKANFDSLMVKPNYLGSGSFKDYYLKASYGQLDIDVDVFGWFQADSGYLYYAKSNAAYMTHVSQLIRKAVLAADSAGVDFSKYDNDNDGYIDGVIVMHSGIGAEEQSAPLPNNFIWSHRSNLGGNAVTLDGVKIDAYGCFPEKRYNSGSYSQVGIGVITHEFGHLLDLPDLYATNTNSEGSGNYANMAGGPWLNNERTPCLHDAWTRMQMGWMNPTVISSTGTYTIPKSLADSNFCFKIPTGQSNEYFLLENRQKKGFDKYLPARGLAVWHINSSKAKLLSQSGSNTVNNDTSNYGVGLIQADGRYDLEKSNNRGDAGDLYPGSANNHNLTPATAPSTALYYKVGGIRQVSNVVLSNITQNADSSITFTLGNKPSAGFTPSSLAGCAPMNVSFENGSAFASHFLWKFNDGSTSALKDVSKIYSTAGSYPVTLYVLDSTNNVVDSVTQTIKVEASPTALYTLTRNDSNSFTLNNNSKNYLYVMWQFGSNQTSSANDPVYKLTAPGMVPFKLIAYSQNMCADTASGELDYWPLGVKEESLPGSAYCYPNPFSQKLTVQLNMELNTEVNISLYDLLGSKIKELYTGPVNTGENAINLEVPALAGGMYLLAVSGPNFKKILRVAHQ